jgi:DNA gyrase subunit A
MGVKIADEDQLLTATLTDGGRELLIATKSGQSIRFDEKQVRAMGRVSTGVKAIALEGDDQVVGLAVTEPDRDQVLAICERGYGKRTPLEEYRSQHRGGKGIILIDAGERNGPVVGIALVRLGDELMLITDRGQTLRTQVDEIRETGRSAQGVKVMNVAGDERVVAFESLGESRAGAQLDGPDEEPGPDGSGTPGGEDGAPDPEPEPDGTSGGGSDQEPS